MMRGSDLIEQWRDGRAGVSDGRLVFRPAVARSLRARLQAAYAWIVDEALACPTFDLELGEEKHLGHRDAQIRVTRGVAFASYALLPLLNLAVGGRLLIVGAPGRGKTTIATLMALLSGATLEEARRRTQRGHPQLTITDLVGGPLPSQLVSATRAEDVSVSWRDWLFRRVKIIDEYNRIPTKTQSALLSLMAEGVAEQYEQVARTGPSAWFLTANDDIGGGTFQVIEALRDRIDLVVRAPAFDPDRLDLVAERVARDRTPEAQLPESLRFDDGELDGLRQEIAAVPVPATVLHALGAFGAQLDFCRRASSELSLMTKETLHLAGKRLSQVCTEDCPLDKQVHLCGQAESGISTRAHQATLVFSRALAWFAGASEVSIEHVRAVLPWVLHDRLVPNAQSAFFMKDENRGLLTDRVSWVRRLFDRSLEQSALRRRSRVLEKRHSTAAAKLAAIESEIERLLEREEFGPMVHADLVRLQRAHAKLRNERRS